MSISTVSISAADGLQHSQKATQAHNRVQRTASTARAASVPGDISKTPAAKAAADAKDGEVKLSTKHVQQSLEEINKVIDNLKGLLFSQLV